MIRRSRIANTFGTAILVGSFIVGCAAAPVQPTVTAAPPTAAPTTVPTSAATSTPVASAGPAATATSSAAGEGTPTMTGSSGNGASGAIPTEAVPLVDRAKQQLASQAGVSIDQIQVVSVSRVAWPNSAIGCPEPGRMYSQIVTNGYRIVLRANNQDYQYHTDLGQRVIFCANPSP